MTASLLAGQASDSPASTDAAVAGVDTLQGDEAAALAEVPAWVVAGLAGALFVLALGALVRSALRRRRRRGA